MLAEFRGFLLKSNALALAIGVIIGGALGTVVNSLVNDILMPPIGYALGGVDFASLKIVLKPAVGGDPATEVAIRWGAFVTNVINFLIIAWVLFMLIQLMNRFVQKEAAKPTPPTKQEELLTEIRDLLKARGNA